MTTAERPLVIAGNWKMNKTRPEARELARAIVDGVAGRENLPDIVLCPPFTSTETVVAVTAGSVIAVGAQNMDYRESGAYTGEISPLMLKELGVAYVILGHSERRQYFGETNATVNLKLKAAIKHGLTPIVCVGETVDERESHLTDSVVSRQVAAALSDIDPAELGRLIIAYEPVWAIGTGQVCEAEEANRVAKLIRGTITNLFNRKDFAQRIPILYGGSVNKGNVAEQLEQSDIDGSLVGGASLKPDEFLSIIEAAQKQARAAVGA
ncbi:MAG TPA: triose-phosphate isomerase [Candidatus Obscuribacterales bacterium]